MSCTAYGTLILFHMLCSTQYYQIKYYRINE